ncbi:hypothetical protein [uncultured Jatrophihabitans sp.]|uniref:hypothetical protein n=1 Tax=uncultured Jatrophihabitans sp. TaxID=1610747 RepID=UPI0035C95CC8
MTDESGDSDLRRRAAWLLGMLALVAVLLVVLLVLVANGGGSGGSGQDNAGPDDTLGPTSTASAASHSSSPSSASSTSAATSSHPERASCPTKSTCALDYDIGDAVAAINAYRTHNGMQAVPGKVSAGAAKCAQHQGDGNCPDGYAETQVTKPTGKSVVAKIEQRAKLGDASMTSFQVGWAFDPGSKQYYFVVAHDD